MKNLNKDMTYNDFLIYWLETYKKPFLKKSSLRGLLNSINNIPLYIKNLSLNELNATIIDNAISQIELSRSRKYVYHVFYNSLKRAYYLDLLDYNLALKINNVRHRTCETYPLTIDEQERFLKKIKGSKYENALKFLLYSGLRRSELISLHIKDFHLKNRVIKVNGTKNPTSQRFIPLTDILLDIYLDQRDKSENGYLFPYHPDTLTHEFKKVCKKHNLHNLRSTYITRCQECGIDINAVYKICGHKSILTTLRIYTKVSQKFAFEEMKKLKI